MYHTNFAHGLHPIESPITDSDTDQVDPRTKRNAVRQNRMLGGVNVAVNSIPYVARLVFDPYNMERSEIDNNLFTQCSGTIIHAHFIITSKSGISDSVDRSNVGNLEVSFRFVSDALIPDLSFAVMQMTKSPFIWMTTK